METDNMVGNPTHVRTCGHFMSAVEIFGTFGSHRKCGNITSWGMASGRSKGFDFFYRIMSDNECQKNKNKTKRDKKLHVVPPDANAKCLVMR